MTSPLRVYDLLFQQHGPQGWWPSDSPFETMVGAVLTQRTAWANAKRSIARLRAAGLLTPDRIRAEQAEALAAYIRPSGFFRAKTLTLYSLCGYLERYGDNIARLRSAGTVRLRNELLAVHGIGPETADAIMLYAICVPTFVVDAYAQRIFTRLGELAAAGSYSHFQAWLTESLPADTALLGEYHALLVRHGGTVCRKRHPCCELCALRPWCAYSNVTEQRSLAHP